MCVIEKRSSSPKYNTNLTYVDQHSRVCSDSGGYQMAQASLSSQSK